MDEGALNRAQSDMIGYGRGIKVKKIKGK